MTDPDPKELMCGTLRKESCRGLGNTKSALAVTCALIHDGWALVAPASNSFWKAWSETMHLDSSSALRLIDLYFLMLVQVLVETALLQPARAGLALQPPP